MSRYELVLFQNAQQSHAHPHAGRITRARATRLSRIRTAAAVGLGCCPISAVRDQPERMSELLELPERVIPVAGLCVGWPAEEGSITPRLPLALTLHQDRYETRGLASEIDAYDLRRAKVRPYARQRALERWGHSDLYGWSEDKARQYAEPLRAGFGTYVRAKGFCLD